MNKALQIRLALTAEQLPAPSQAWMQALISQQPSQQQQSLSVLVATARARLLAADLTTPGLLDPAAASGLSFPSELVGTATASVQEVRLAHDVVVQVLDLENLSQSRWQQVQELEAIERGEQKRGREIIRLPVGGDNDDDEDASGGGSGGNSTAGRGGTGASSSATPAAAGANTTHRLVLQDCRGNTLFGVELTRIPRIGIGRLSIGEKLLLKEGAAVARGLVLLEPGNVKFLGGKIEALHKAWVDGRLARLRAAAQSAP